MIDRKHKQGNGWDPARCARQPGGDHAPNAIGGAGEISPAVRDMFVRAFQSLTEPTPSEGSPITWALADCVVNGRPSMAILAVTGGRAHPVFVVPPPGTRLRNWSGDALEVKEHALMRGPAND